MKSLMPSISLTDLDLFIRVSKLKSLRESARQLNMTPGAISKILKRFEKKLGFPIISRSAKGILITAEGKQLINVGAEVLRLMTQLNPDLAGDTTTRDKVWGIGSISFLSTCLLSKCVQPLSVARPHTRFRIVEFTHNRLVAHGLNGAFEIALHVEALEWTRIWSSHAVGKLRWGLFAASDHPLTKLKRVTELEVIRYPFIVPTGWTDQGFSRGEDFCPIPWGKRIPGHEAVTGETALEMVQATLHLSFLPVVLAKKSSMAHLVKEIKVEGMSEVNKSIYLSVRDDLVSKPFLNSLIDLIREELK